MGETEGLNSYGGAPLPNRPPSPFPLREGGQGVRFTHKHKKSRIPDVGARPKKSSFSVSYFPSKFSFEAKIHLNPPLSSQTYVITPLIDYLPAKTYIRDKMRKIEDEF